MPTIISPSSPVKIPLTLSCPADGELANAASVNGAFQSILDGLDSVRQIVSGGGPRRRVECFSDTVMSIKPLGAVPVLSGGLWKTYSHSVATTVSPTALAGGSLTASTRYWVYAYDNAGTLDFAASANAPDASLRYMSGNQLYMYVTTFFVDAASHVLHYAQVDADYTYYSRTALGSGLSGNLILDQGTATSRTDVTYGVAALPSQATVVKIQVLGKTTGSVGWVNAGAFPAASADFSNGFSLATPVGIGAGVFETPREQTVVCYQVSNASNDKCSLWIAGFRM